MDTRKPVMKIIQQFLLRPYLYLIIIMIGTGLKFYHLETRYFWLDEIYTIEQTSGIPDKEYPAFFPENVITNINGYHDVLHLNKQGCSIGAQLNGMVGSPNFSPAHYVFLLFWNRLVGDDYLDYRLFSIFCYLLSLFFLFIFTKELFQSGLSAWIIVSLFSVSPFCHVYIQEARYYILWICTILLTCYIYLKATTLNKPGWWVAYSIIGTLALYTSSFSGLVLFGHLVHTFFFKKQYRLKFCMNLAIIVLLYSPWFYTIIVHREEISKALSWQLNWKESQQIWEPVIWQFIGFAHAFVSLESHIWAGMVLDGKIRPDLVMPLIISILVIAVELFAVVYIIRKSSKATWMFMVLLMLPTILIFCISDVVRNGYLSFTWRYQLINLVGMIIITGYCLSMKVHQGKLLFAALYLGLVAISLISVGNITKHRCWSAFENECKDCVDESALFSKNGKPLLITDFSHWMGLNGFFELIIQCESKNIDILRASPEIEHVQQLIDAKGYSDIYVVQASDSLINNLKRQYGERMVSIKNIRVSSLWHIKN
jgi:uncharacterized membrane protein